MWDLMAPEPSNNGGTHTVANDLSLGHETGSLGVYDLTGGSLNTTNTTIGKAGGGIFRQSGNSSHAVNGALTLGSNPNSSGGYFLDGGTLTTTTTEVGLSGKGNFNQFGNSSHTVTGNLTLGGNSGSDGNYFLEGGSLSGTATTLITTNTVVGNLGTGTFTQEGTDSSHTVSNDLIVGADGSGFYSLNAGTLQTNRTIIGQNGSGTFYQNGASHSVNTDLILGSGSSGQGSYDIMYGQVDTGNLTVGLNGQGTFTQNQHTGVHVVNTLTLGAKAGSSGTYNLGGSFSSLVGHLDAAQGVVGDAGSGTFTHSLGRFTVFTDLILGQQTGGSGTYLFSEGTLEAGNLIVGRDGTGSFSQSGGTNTLSGDLTLAQNGGSSGTYNLSGGTLTTLNIFLNTNGIFNQTGGSLNPTNTIVGNTGTGTFTQNGGSQTISNALTLAATAGSTGIYNLINGSLTAALTNINTGGTFNQTGGAFNTTTLNIYTGGSFNFTSGAFSYTTLNLQGGNLSGNLQIQGLLSGTGTLTGNITNSGLVSPGTSPGVLNIVGSFTQTPAGTYLMEMAAASSYDQIKVTGAPGTASVDGTLTPVLLGGYTPVWNQVFPGIITATNGMAGNFSTINSTFPWLVQFNAARTSLDLRVGGYNFANPNFALTANQRKVGLMLNQVSDTASGDLGTVLPRPCSPAGRGGGQRLPGDLPGQSQRPAGPEPGRIHDAVAKPGQPPELPALAPGGAAQSGRGTFRVFQPVLRQAGRTDAGLQRGRPERYGERSPAPNRQRRHLGGIYGFCLLLWQAGFHGQRDRL